MGNSSGRPPGPGPVFEFEWVTASRRWQGYALRSFFVLSLLAALIVTWSSRTAALQPTTFRGLAEIGRMFYVAVIGTELTLVLLAAPAATAGAICIDRARGTLTHLLVTDLTDAEIVLGKLAARLVPVLGLVSCSLPVMALLVLLGGVDPDALLGAFAVTVGIALMGCALALCFSLWAGKTHEALLGTYAVWGLWLLGPSMLGTLGGALGVSFPKPPTSIDPFHLVLGPYWSPGQLGWLDYLTFLGLSVLVSALLVALAVWRLRPVCAREKVKKPRKARGPSRHFPVLSAIGPSLDFNPVFWREWHRNRSKGWARAVGVVYVVLAATFSLVAVCTRAPITAAFVNGFQVPIGLLMLSVSAATSLAEERARGSLDVLMATPMSTRQIVLGKWLGTFRLVPWLAALPALVILWGGGNGRYPTILGATILAAYILGCGAAVTSLGIALATWCSRLGRAVGLTVSAFVAMTVGWMFLVMSLCSPNPVGFALISASPFYGPVLVTIESREQWFGGVPEFHIAWPLLWAFLYMALALVLLLATLATFNRCLGRLDEGLPFGRRWERGAVELVRVDLAPVAEAEEVVGPGFAR